MIRRAMALVRDETEAHELVQDVCIKLWENSSGLASADNPTAYCLRAVHNAAISVLRRQKRFDSLDEVSQEPTVEPSDESDYLKALIEQLPQNLRAAFLLRQEGFEYETIARRLGVQPENVRQMICRARKRLRELYAQEY